MRVLLIDDDARLVRMVERFLSKNDVEVTVARSGQAGYEIALENDFDAIVLDIMMPGWTGFDTLRAMRDRGLKTPILFLTGSDSTDHLVEALEGGGDAFVEKPFEMRGLLARLRALARRSPSAGRTVLFGGIEIDTVRHRASWNKASLALTRTELRLLHVLVDAGGEVVSRQSLRRAAWGEDPEVGTESLGVHVSNLRKRLEEVGATGVIETIRGKGYRLVEV